MIVRDKKLVEILNYGFGVEYTEYDLEDSKIQKMFSNITELRLKSNDFTQESINELEAMIDYCPNLKFLAFDYHPRLGFFDFDYNFDHTENENINNINFDNLAIKLLQKEIKTHIPEVNDVDALYNAIMMAIPSFKIRRNYLKINNFKNIDQEIYVLDNHIDDEIAFLYGNISKENYTLDDYLKYRELILKHSNVSSRNIQINHVFDISDEQWNLIIKNDYTWRNSIVITGAKEDTKLSLDEFDELRKVMKEIVSQIEMPKDDDPNREKKIFAQLYLILGKRISYDYFDASQEWSPYTALPTNCRNLKNGLLGVERNGEKKFLSICSGYAEILQEFCTYLGITCNYLSSFSPLLEEYKYLQYQHPKKGVAIYKNGTDNPRGHAYNMVKLDGKYYLCDLTWDASYLKLDYPLPLHFLKSYDDFYKSHNCVGFGEDDINNEIISQDGTKFKMNQLSQFCLNESLSNKEIERLLGCNHIDSIATLMSENYLSGFVNDYFDFILQTKGELDFSDYATMVKEIKDIEQIIKSSDFNAYSSEASRIVTIEDKNGQVFSKKIPYYPGPSKMSKQDLIDSVFEVEEKVWKKR